MYELLRCEDFPDENSLVYYIVMFLCKGSLMLNFNDMKNKFLLDISVSIS